MILKDFGQRRLIWTFIVNGLIRDEHAQLNTVNFMCVYRVGRLVLHVMTLISWITMTFLCEWGEGV